MGSRVLWMLIPAVGLTACYQPLHLFRMNQATPLDSAALRKGSRNATTCSSYGKVLTNCGTATIEA